MTDEDIITAQEREMERESIEWLQRRGYKVLRPMTVANLMPGEEFHYGSERQVVTQRGPFQDSDSSGVFTDRDDWLPDDGLVYVEVEAP